MSLSVYTLLYAIALKMEGFNPNPAPTHVRRRIAQVLTSTTESSVSNVVNTVSKPPPPPVASRTNHNSLSNMSPPAMLPPTIPPPPPPSSSLFAPPLPSASLQGPSQAEFDALKAKLVVANETIKANSDKIFSLEGANTAYCNEVTTRNAELAAAHAIIAVKDKEIAFLNATTAGLEEEVADLRIEAEFGTGNVIDETQKFEIMNSLYNAMHILNPVGFPFAQVHSSSEADDAIRSTNSQETIGHKQGKKNPQEVLKVKPNKSSLVRESNSSLSLPQEKNTAVVLEAPVNSSILQRRGAQKGGNKVVQENIVDGSSKFSLVDNSGEAPLAFVSTSVVSGSAKSNETSVVDGSSTLAFVAKAKPYVPKFTLFVRGLTDAVTNDQIRDSNYALKVLGDLVIPNGNNTITFGREKKKVLLK